MRVFDTNDIFKNDRTNMMEKYELNFATTIFGRINNGCLSTDT